MRIIDRYIIRELATSLALGLGVFTFVLLTDKIRELMDLIISKHVPVDIVARLFLYILPELFVLTIPMALLLAVVATYGRLAAEHELTALKVTGSSFYRLARPAFAVGIVAMVFTAFNTFYAVPHGSQAFLNLLFLLTRTRATVGIQERIFNDDFHGLILYTNHINEAKGVMEGVFVVDTQDEEKQRIIMARRGRVVPDERQNVVLLELEGGSTHITIDNKADPYQILRFQTLNLALSVTDPRAVGADETEPEALTVSDLLATVRERRTKGEPTAKLLVSFHRRFAAPVACLVFILLGAPLAIRVRRSGRGISLALTLMLAMTYYILMISGQGMGKRGLMPPFLASWLPNLVLGSIGLLLFIGCNSDSWLPRFLMVRGKRSPVIPEIVKVP